LLGAVTVSEALREVEASLAVIFATTWLVTALVVILNVAVAAPDGIFTVAGVVTKLELLLRLTVSPALGAEPEMETFPVVAEPPAMVEALSVIPFNSGGSTVKVAPIDVEDRLAVIFAVCEVDTAFVVTPNVAESLPAATTTLAGTTASLELLASLIVSPPVGADEEILTVPLADAPPGRLVGLTSTEESVGAFTVKSAFDELVPIEADIATTVFAFTEMVSMGKVAVMSPDPTVTELPTVAAAPADFSKTTTPLVPAFFDRVTVPAEEVPPTTLAGEILNLETV